MKITIAQLNPVVGCVDENSERVLEILSNYGNKTDLIVFPELFLTGYPPRDLLEKPSFVEKIREALAKITQGSALYTETGLAIGVPVETGKKSGKGLYNSAVFISGGRTLDARHKSLLPAYDVFDETRYFDPADSVSAIPFKGEKLGISICEDMWSNPELWPKELYHFDPIEKLARSGATIMINLSASPFHVEKEDLRYKLVRHHVKKYGVPFVFVNQIGGNDELIFDGRSFCVSSGADPIAVFPSFEEHVETIDTNAQTRPGIFKPQEITESVYRALVLGIRDYMRKCGFTKAVVGLSGGVDSALTATLAKEAVGAENVLGISLPSPFSSKESMEYARLLAEKLGIEFKIISIDRVYSSYIEMLRKEFAIKEDEVDVTLQNIQARIRGDILMAFSNRFGYLVISTGNKSELAVGYCTLYGDMAGGLAAISDVPKTMVYKLANYINTSEEIIPEAIIKRAPSAELAPGQLDQDTLPPYEVLDKILYHYLEEEASIKEILSKGFDADTVRWAVSAINKNEYKRRQSPPGLKITSKAFGVGRRMPIAARCE